MTETLIAVLLLVGAAFTLVGSIGLARLGDFYMRLHGPTKATTLGVGAMLVGSTLYFSGRGGVSLHELLVAVFLFMTAPVSAHLLAKAALHLRLPNASGAPGERLPAGVDETAARGETGEFMAPATAADPATDVPSPSPPPSPDRAP